jgi:hypothetical protein
MDDTALWSLEHRFWTSSDGRDGAALDPRCVMAFPSPFGIIAGPTVAESLAQAPPWISVSMGEQHLARPAPGLAVLAYRVRGERDGAGSYEAYCTSCYREAEDGWMLIQHQQTPIG